MSEARNILKRIEEHKGKKLDLTNNRDLTRFIWAIDREISKRDIIINNVRKVLSGDSTYDDTKYKVIIDSSKK